MENSHFVGKNLSKSAIKTVLFELARSRIRVDPFLHKVEFQNYVMHFGFGFIVFVEVGGCGDQYGKLNGKELPRAPRRLTPSSPRSTAGHGHFIK